MTAPILLATDGSPQARLAARAAGDLSLRWGVPLEIVHVCSLPAATWEVRASDAVLESLRSVSEGILREQARTLERSGVPVNRTHMVLARPLDGVMQVAGRVRPQLLVLGSRGLGGVERMLLGSVSEGLVHNARWPVLVVRGGRRAWPPAAIIAGEDGSDEARYASEMGARIASAFGVPLQLVTALSPRWNLTPGGVRQDLSRQRAARRHLKEVAVQLGQASAVIVRTSCVTADAAQALTSAAGPASAGKVVVVGSRGLGAIQRMRLGSTSTKVLRGAAGPVVVVPPAKRPEPE